MGLEGKVRRRWLGVGLLALLVATRRPLRNLILSLYVLYHLPRRGRARGIPFLTKIVREEVLSLPTSAGSLSATLYRSRPQPRERAGIVFLHGLTPLGHRDPVLVHLAHLLARIGFTVLSPDLPGLQQLFFSPQDIHCVEEILLYAREGLDTYITPGWIGLGGLGIGGGYALLASARPEIRDRVAFVVSLDGYASLKDLLYFHLAPRETVPTRVGTYGRLLALLQAMPALGLSGEDQASLDRLVHALSRCNYPGAAEALEAAQAVTPMPLQALLDGSDPRYARRALAYLEERDDKRAALSPAGEAEGIRAPVFLLHARDDELIPYTQTLAMAKALAAAGRPPNHCVITQLFGRTPAPYARKRTIRSFLTEGLGLLRFLFDLIDLR